MSILTNNGKVFTLGGSVLNYTPPIYGVDFTNMETTSKCTRTNWAIYPSRTGGSETNGSCDNWYSSSACLYCGGSYSQATY